MSDFSNFRAVYNELTDAVTSARHQFFKDHLANFFDTIDQTPNAARIVADLESRVDLKKWYEEAKESVGSFVGSGTLNWPKGRTEKLAMRVALLRAFSTEAIDPIDFAHDFLYSENNFDINISDISQQLFSPTGRELLRYIETHFDNPPGVPASDRVVTVNHNSPDYADADAAMEKLEKAIREANDFPEPEVKEQREAEVSAARRLMRAVRVRLEPLVALLKPLLVQYGTKVKDGLIAAAAAATTAALITLFGLIFKSLLGL
ncbi:hypothetical protein [Bradyrhizobium sp. JYMT SZCCT0180]|uniref:hypothetical protein n=1 Tax=Bradyrhizobium sp. JYMT SZCCT0180 TaxID=2807666 RepID=UPI001BA800E0|nr:hypothetical protein [Bradyrhizobium sp. JYMT SZCCT0180]MBR1214618.1 hypothetical protein [Bradyrhizobium sp. JYMT SZCCT0180]